MKRIRLTVAYDGTQYCGWQIQPNGVTIEAVLNENLSALTGEDIHVIGASRTDAGVHALGNVAVFDTQSSIPSARFAYALNQRLPEDIRIVDSTEVPLDWHPRYQKGIHKTYEYHIYNAQTPDPLKRQYSAYISYPLDIEQMRAGAACLIGEHDFASFCNVKTDTDDTVRTIEQITIQAEKAHRGSDIIIQIRGTGFLYNMVRIIAGTLIRVGRGYYPPEKVQDILEAKERTEAGVTAPPQGLILVEVTYN